MAPGMAGVADPDDHGRIADSGAGILTDNPVRSAIAVPVSKDHPIAKKILRRCHRMAPAPSNQNGNAISVR
jgi:hypothetical protein